VELVDARPPNSQRRDVPLLPLEVDVGLCLSQPPPLPPRNLGSDTDRMPLPPPGSMTEEPAEQASELDGEPMFGAGVLVSLKASSASGLLCCIVQSTSSAFQNAATSEANGMRRQPNATDLKQRLGSLSATRPSCRDCCRCRSVSCASDVGPHISVVADKATGRLSSKLSQLAGTFRAPMNECPRRESCSSQKHHRDIHSRYSIAAHPISIRANSAAVLRSFLKTLPSRISVTSELTHTDLCIASAPGTSAAIHANALGFTNSKLAPERRMPV